jgi:hypothetical protein
LEFKDVGTTTIGDVAKKEGKRGKSWIYEIPVKADGRGRFDLVSLRGFLSCRVMLVVVNDMPGQVYVHATCTSWSFVAFIDDESDQIADSV